MITTFQALLALWLFALGAVIGSFLNVCIYRIPWEKSVIWPGSHCPRCLARIAARDNIPILSWLALRGECRTCGQPIPARYALVELLVGVLFVAVFLVDVVADGGGIGGMLPYARMLYHLALVVLLVAAAFIDADYTIIPDSITVPGMVLGLLGGTLVPEIRPDPASAATWPGGLVVGLIGWAVGGGLTWLFRFVFTHIFRREAMGFGDVTLMAMIGAFLGWQGAVLTFFLAPFFGLPIALGKMVLALGKWMRGRQLSSADRELPFGPYLSMAAVGLVLSWRWLWPGWARGLFETLKVFVLSLF